MILTFSKLIQFGQYALFHNFTTFSDLNFCLWTFKPFINILNHVNGARRTHDLLSSVCWYELLIDHASFIFALRKNERAVLHKPRCSRDWERSTALNNIVSTLEGDQGWVRITWKFIFTISYHQGGPKYGFYFITSHEPSPNCILFHHIISW